MQYTIRRAMPNDFPAVNRLCLAAYQEYETVVGPANWLRMQETLARASDLASLGTLIVAEDISELLGVVLYIPPGKSDGASIPAAWASMRMLAVSPAGRGQGIGKKLVQECIDQARRDGAAAIGLTTADMMKIAQPMYERMGFQKIAELGERFGVKEVRYVLVLH